MLLGATALGIAAQSIYGCVGDPKSYRECTVAGFNIATVVFAAQYIGLFTAVWLWAPLGVVLAAISLVLHLKR